MSTKRKAIVFDLVDNKKIKIPRTPHRVTYRNDVSPEHPQEDFVSYMQPEILTLSFMLELLVKCNVRSSCLTGKSREEIQKLFLEHVTPKPQRHYSNTRVGKVLSAMQEKYACSPTPDWQRQVMESCGTTSATRPHTNLALLLPATTASDRLKPPLKSLINTERKIIKLGRGGKAPTTLTVKKTSDLDEIDQLLKPKLKKKVDDTLKIKSLLNPSSKRIILSKVAEETVSKKLKIERDGASKSDTNNSKASTPPGNTARPAVAWP